MLQPWNYLIVTASNDAQARAYESQLAIRQTLGLLGNIGQWMVVADPQSKRIGSGGSTIYCLIQVLNRELDRSGGDPSDRTLLERILRDLRILIIHAGGDSRRVPAYGPCGKIFVPVPGEGDNVVGCTLFDRQLPIYRALPAMPPGAGQVVVTAGDALIRFDPSIVRFAEEGMTALGCYASVEAASKHGVFCVDAGDKARLYLQKPKPDEQRRLGAVNRDGQSILDIGAMSFDAATAMIFLNTFEVGPDASGKLAWSESMTRTMLTRGLDIYREVCCAMGAEATAAHHLSQARSAGSSWDEAMLARVYQALHAVPFGIQVLPQCSFLHFGTTKQLITSGQELVRQDQGVMPAEGLLSINNHFGPSGRIIGQNSCVEGCRVGATLTLAGRNVIVGVDIDQPLSMPAGACLDVVRGRSRAGRPVHFIRAYGVEDTFKDAAHAGGTLCGHPLPKWLAAVGAKPEDIWDASIAPEKRTLWDARVFPTEPEHGGYRNWMWMYHPLDATASQKRAFLAADRYSAAEIAILAEQDDFYARRALIRAHDGAH